MIVFVNNSHRPRKKRKPKAGPIAQKLNRKELEKVLTTKIPSYSVSNGGYKSICVDRAGGAGRQSMTDARFLANESEETRKEILRKASSIAPAYSKGAYQYVSSEEDAKYVGRKL
jgi:hypothetical protein